MAVGYGYPHIMCLVRQLLKGLGFAHLENIEQIPCHTLGEHLHIKGFI